MTTTQTEGKGARGRKDADKQEAVLQHETVATRVDELLTLYRRQESAAAAFGDAVKKCAEDSGFLASVVRRFVAARAGERFAEKHRENEQLELLFTEVGE